MACVLAVVALLVLLRVPASTSSAFLGTRMLSVHLVLELFAMVIAALVVIVSWHTFDTSRERPTTIVMGGFLVVAVCDLFHALSYAGMPDFLTKSNTPSAIYFWLAGRSVEVATLAAIALDWSPRMSRGTSLSAGVLAAAALVWFGTYHVDALPDLFVPGLGVTPFKARYEYTLCALNLAVAVLLLLQARRRRIAQYELLAMSSFMMGIGELAFTAYVAPSDFQNVFGHVYKLIAYSFLYRATFIGTIRGPFDALSASEARLRESEQRLRTLSDNLPQSIVYQLAWDSDGSKRIIHVSEALERIVGLRVIDVLRDASLLFQRIHPDDINGFTQTQQQSADTMQSYDMQLRVRGTADRWLRMNFVAAPRRLQDGRIVWDGILTDVTERELAVEETRRLESKLFEAQKMDSIGTLASGIAHDFNNVLGSILGNVALAIDDVGKGATQDALASLEQVRKAGLRARELVRQILTFSRRQVPLRTVQALGPIVDEGLALLRATLPAQVSLQTHIEHTPMWVLVDATQIEQIVLNLCTNAWQSMGEAGGRIDVGLAVAEPLGHAAFGPDLKHRSYAQLWVADNGAGMDEATRARVFEPFFTTKSIGVGTGLGLSVVHGIVRACDGVITVESTPGKGTRFDVYLPIADAAGQAEHGRTNPPSVAAGRGKHVMYLDDDHVMTLMVERLLEHHGYDVSVFSDPALAVEAVRSNPDTYDVLVTDFNMPGMSGLDVIRAIDDVRPDLPRVLSSGWVSDELRSRAQEFGVQQVLEKQYTLETLPAAIERACRPRSEPRVQPASA